MQSECQPANDTPEILSLALRVYQIAFLTNSHSDGLNHRKPESSQCLGHRGREREPARERREPSIPIITAQAALELSESGRSLSAAAPLHSPLGSLTLALLAAARLLSLRSLWLLVCVSLSEFEREFDSSHCNRSGVVRCLLLTAEERASERERSPDSS